MSYIVVLECEDTLYYSKMERGTTLVFGSGKKDSVKVDALSPSRYTVTNKNGIFNIRVAGNFSRVIDKVQLDRHIKLDSNGRNYFYISESGGTSKNTFELPYDGNVSVGRNDKNDIVLKRGFVSGKHFVIRCKDGNIRVEDCDSTNGLYLNGKKIKNAVLRSGDVLNILTLSVKLTNRVLSFEDVNAEVLINHRESKNRPDIKSRESFKSKKLAYRRSPRIRERMPQEDIILATPPAAAQEFDSTSNFANIINYGTMMATSLVYGMANPLMLALRTATSASNMYFSRKRNKEMKEKLETYERDRKDKYTAYMQEQYARISKVAQVQQRILTTENPEPKECLTSAMELRRNIWERCSADNDFLDIRLGEGPVDLCVNIKSRSRGQGFSMRTDSMEELCELIAEEKLTLNAPVRVELTKYNNIGVIGDRDKVMSLVRNMIISISALHSYQDVRIVGIFDEEERASWSSLRWLPHTWNDNKQFRFLAFDKQRAHVVCDIINDIAIKRLASNNKNEFEKKSVPSPHYVLIFGSREMTEREQIMQTLSMADSNIGITALLMYDDVYYLPQNCEYIIEVDDEPSAYERTGLNHKSYFEPDEKTDRREFDKFARRLSAINLEDLHTELALPNSVTFLEGFGVKKASELNVESRWLNGSTGSLVAPIGVLSSGKTFNLDIAASADGPHGLIAGTTGSGKSEFIQSLILSMATNYHPYEVNFIIIDYKGGSLANILEPLPHVIGKITNIDSDTERILTSITAEKDRRMRMLADNGDISFDRYQQLFKAGKVSEPMPHLVIVADEFAELKLEEPEFLAGLTQVARVGRSLGIHLILATQKPSGIVNDQIESNSRFRVCMKVNDVTDSREVIKRADAATITQAGRGYVRVGNDEVFELIQSFYSGARYSVEDTAKVYKNKVRIVDATGQRIDMNDDGEKTMRDDVKSELDVIIEYISHQANKMGIQKLPGVWRQPLPTEISLRQLGVDTFFTGEKWHKYNGKVCVPIGLYDCPQLQSQGVQYIDFSEKYHYAIYGGPTSGKTNLIKTLISSISLSYSPDDVNIYAIDFGGRSLNNFGQLPHVSCVALDYEEDKLLKLTQTLIAEKEKRAKIFQTHNIGAYAEYRRSVGDDLAEVFILVDNLLLALKQYPFLQDFFEKIVADGSTYGIHLIFTANGQNGISQKILMNISGAIALTLTNRTDYNSYVGAVNSLTIPDQIGSAVTKQGVTSSLIKFQTALFEDGMDEVQRNNALRITAEKMNSVAVTSDVKMKFMPDVVDFGVLKKEYTEVAKIPVGIEYSTLDTAFVGADNKYVINISGEYIKDTIPVMKSVVDMLQSNSANELYLLDNLDGDLLEYKTIASGYACYQDEVALKKVLNAVIEIMNERKNHKDEFFEYSKQVCVVINDVNRFCDTASDVIQKAISALCRLGLGLGIFVVVSSDIDTISKRSITNLVVRDIVSSKKLIAVSGKPLLYSCYGKSFGDSQSQELKENKAMVLDGDNINFINPRVAKGDCYDNSDDTIFDVK